MYSNVPFAAQVLRRSAARIADDHRIAQRYPDMPGPTGVIETIAVVASGDRYWRNLADCKQLYWNDETFTEIVDMLCGYLATSGRLTLQPGEGLNQVWHWATDPAVTPAEVVGAMRAAAAFHSSLVGGDR
ncbi:hypothetical protein [Dactylosporangium sp. NPDC050588]|uniref:DUF6197 family protein n=1 Tax=Dactylosporangium sp. NPDC050588 TaxID=3157211 RepID=UPI003406EC3C